MELFVRISENFHISELVKMSLTMSLMLKPNDGSYCIWVSHTGQSDDFTQRYNLIAEVTLCWIKNAGNLQSTLILQFCQMHAKRPYISWAGSDTRMPVLC